jgi:hypothetical protein
LTSPADVPVAVAGGALLAVGATDEVVAAGSGGAGGLVEGAAARSVAREAAPEPQPASSITATARVRASGWAARAAARVGFMGPPPGQTLNAHPVVGVDTPCTPPGVVDS